MMPGSYKSEIQYIRKKINTNKVPSMSISCSNKCRLCPIQRLLYDV